jgi:ABC-2 type transport system permease protein
VADGPTTELKAAVGGRLVRATLPEAEPERMRGLATVTAVQVHGEAVTLRCTDPDSVLRTLVADFPAARDFEVTGLGLEEAFLALTGDGPATATGSTATDSSTHDSSTHLEDPPGGADMMPTLLHLELRRALRHRRTLGFAAVLPMVSFATFSSGANGQVGGLDVAPYVMVGMAAYGAINALFTGGGLIAAEPAVGWNRQLRIAGLSGRVYVATKALTCYLTALPGLLAVFALGALVRHVDLGSAQWVQAAAAILLGLAPVAALGIAIGYFARPQTLQPLFSMVRRCWHCWGGCGCQRRPSLMWYRT